MKFINVIDELNRFVELKIYDTKENLQADSHTYSYFYRREMFKDLGFIMGLEKKCMEPMKNYKNKN